MRRPPNPISCLLLAVLAALLVAPPLAAQDDREAGLFAEARQLPLVSQSVSVTVHGGDAAVELVQVFANEGDDVAQADYRLHLPREATVDGFGFWRAGRFLAAELRERAEARAAHRTAATEGRATVLLETDEAIHSFSVFPIPAGDLQQVATTLRLPVVVESGRSHVRLPVDRFLGHAGVESTVLARLETTEPLRAVGVDGASPALQGRGDRWATLALTSTEPITLWWAEENPPLLARAEAVPLDDGRHALQIRLALNDAGDRRPPWREVVALVDASFSMRRHAEALAYALERLADRCPVPLRVVAVAEESFELSARTASRDLVAEIFATGGHRATVDDLGLTAAAFGCSDPAVRCLAITDPQLGGLDDEPDGLPGVEPLFLADADELAFFGDLLDDAALVHLPKVDPRGDLLTAVDELVLPVLELTAARQRGGTLEIHGPGRLRVAEGGLLRVTASSRSTVPIELDLALAGRAFTRRVPVTVMDPLLRPGRSIRRGLFTELLRDWMAEYRLHRDPELREQIVDVSLREGIPTGLTALHVADPELGATLPRGGTAAPLLRRLGGTLLALAVLALWLAGGRQRADGSPA